MYQIYKRKVGSNDEWQLAHYLFFENKNMAYGYIMKKHPCQLDWEFTIAESKPPAKEIPNE